MPHKSRQRIIVIDCKTSDLASAGRFWAGALGGAADIGHDGKYATIKPTTDHMVILQAGVDHEPRVHIDIETDNQAAEVAQRIGRPSQGGDASCVGSYRSPLSRRRRVRRAVGGPSRQGWSGCSRAAPRSTRARRASA